MVHLCLLEQLSVLQVEYAGWMLYLAAVENPPEVFQDRFEWRVGVWR